jgi:hypothetical protein
MQNESIYQEMGVTARALRTGETKSSSPVLDALGVQERLIELLLTNLYKLRVRLEPVSNPQPEKSGSVGLQEPTDASPVISRVILTNNQRIETVLALIDSTMESLEI